MAVTPTINPVAPLAMWLALQLATMLVVVLRVPLAAQYPEPAERMGVYLITGVQLGAAALLFPFLLRGRRHAAQAVAATWPFLLTAGYLAGAEAASLLWPAAWVAGWLVTLALWVPLLSSPRTRAFGVAAAGLLALGGAAIAYLRVEFAGGSTVAAPGFESASPLPSTWAGLGGIPTPGGWILLAALAGSAMAVRVAGSQKRRSNAARPAPVTGVS